TGGSTPARYTPSPAPLSLSTWSCDSAELGLMILYFAPSCLLVTRNWSSSCGLRPVTTNSGLKLLSLVTYDEMSDADSGMLTVPTRFTPAEAKIGLRIGSIAQLCGVSMPTKAAVL